MNAPDSLSSLLVQVAEASVPRLDGVLARRANPIVITDAQRRIVWVNQDFVDRTGYTLAEVVGRSPGALLQCEDTDAQTVRALRQALDAGQPIHTRLLNRDRQGRRYWIDLDIQPFGPAGATPTGFIAVQPEISAAREVSDRVRDVLDTAAAGIVVQDPDGRIVHCNAAAEQLLGRWRDEVPDLQWTDPRWQVVGGTGSDGSPGQHPSLHTLATGEPVRDALMGLQRGAGRCWLRVNTSPLPREDGVGWVVSSFIDVSWRHEVDLQVRTEWERLRATLAGSRIAAWEWNLQTHEVRFDAHGVEMIGWLPEDLTPFTPERWASLTHEDDRKAAEAELRRHLRGEVEHYDVECRLLPRDGEWRWVRSRGRIATRSEDGRARVMFGTFEDITARKEAEIATARAHSMLKGLFDLAPVGIGLIDLNSMEPLDYNPALCRKLGYRLDELLSAPLRDCLPGSSAAVRRRNCALAREQGGYGPDEVTLRHKNGQAVEVVLSGALVHGNDGMPYVWSIVQDITQRKAMERELRRAAEQDRLTGLPNRAVLMDRLEQLARRAREAPGFRFALLFLDFDRFKLVNDTLGHEAGDELLIELAQRLQVGPLSDREQAAPHESFAARFGGDEFVYVAVGIDGVGEAQAIADRLQAAVSAPFNIKGHDIHSSASIGIAMGDATTGGALELLRNADTAMYEAKRVGRSTTVVFDDRMHLRLKRAMRIESGLRLAIEREEFIVLYQPIVDLETGRMSSVESLLRWHHPEMGAVSPAEFIPIAEESGQIIAVGEWVLRESCLQWARWQREDAALAPASVSVNLSRVQMALGNRLLLVVRSALADAQMPPQALQLEITEREVMKDPAAARELLLGLSALGVKLAMDDFGTGTSSLGCLRDYPFDTIKIDKSFVTDLSRDPHVLAVAHATINVIENLGMTSVAEGIEDPAEMAMLQAMGCRYGQGFLFARALSPDKLLATMAAPPG